MALAPSPQLESVLVVMDRVVSKTIITLSACPVPPLALAVEVAVIV